MSKLKEIVEQLESCGYECVAGKLENNVAFIELKRLAEQEGEHARNPVDDLSNTHQPLKGRTKLNLDDVVRNKTTGEYGTVHYSSFGYSIHTWDEGAHCLGKTVGAPANEILEHWEVVELPEGYVKAPYGGIRKPKTHELKTFPQYFYAVQQGLKPFEIRRNDRKFLVGDRLLLKEWNPLSQRYTGEELLVEVTYITDFEQKDGYVVMGIKPVAEGVNEVG